MHPLCTSPVSGTGVLDTGTFRNLSIAARRGSRKSATSRNSPQLQRYASTTTAAIMDSDFYHRNCMPLLPSGSLVYCVDSLELQTSHCKPWLARPNAASSVHELKDCFLEPNVIGAVGVKLLVEHVFGYHVKYTGVLWYDFTRTIPVHTSPSKTSILPALCRPGFQTGELCFVRITLSV